MVAHNKLLNTPAIPQVLRSMIKNKVLNNPHTSHSCPVLNQSFPCLVASWGQELPPIASALDGPLRPILTARAPWLFPRTCRSRMAAFGEWRGLLYPQYQPLKRPVSGYHGGLQMTLCRQSFCRCVSGQLLAPTTLCWRR